MTLTLCIKAKDGIVLASDSRASAGLTANDTVKKLFKLDDHAAVGIAGDGSVAMTLLDALASSLNFRLPIPVIAEQLRVAAKEKFQDYFSHQQPQDRPALDILLAGYNGDVAEIYRLGSQDNFVPRKSATGFDCIGIPIIADYLLNRVYDSEVTVEHAAEMAAFCIIETATQDFRVGGPIQIASFSNTKTFASFSKEEIKKIADKCDSFALFHKTNFYPENKDAGTTTPKDAQKIPTPNQPDKPGSSS